MIRLLYRRAQSAYAFLNSIGVNTHLNHFDRTYGNFASVKNDLSAIDIHYAHGGDLP
ncbi:MAG: hypothetical protein ABSD59_15260 [Terracidiphilus sp.]|jgi:hypothetical protein